MDFLEPRQLLEALANAPRLALLAAVGASMAVAALLWFASGLGWRRYRKPAADSELPMRRLERLTPHLGPPAVPGPQATSDPQAAPAAAPSAGAGAAEQAAPPPRTEKVALSWALVGELLPAIATYCEALRPLRTALEDLERRGEALTEAELAALRLPEVDIPSRLTAQLSGCGPSVAHGFLDLDRDYRKLQFALANAAALTLRRPLEAEWSGFLLERATALLEAALRLTEAVQDTVTVGDDERPPTARRLALRD